MENMAVFKNFEVYRHLKRAEVLCSSDCEAVRKIGVKYLEWLHASGSVYASHSGEEIATAYAHAIKYRNSVGKTALELETLNNVFRERLFWGLEFITPEMVVDAAEKIGCVLTSEDVEAKLRYL